jgi:hypothetical protein
MPSVTTGPKTRKDSRPLSTKALSLLRKSLPEAPSRTDLERYGVSHQTVIAALAGLPISRGSRSLIATVLLAPEDLAAEVA